jgi:hypothetical protein
MHAFGCLRLTAVAAVAVAVLSNSTSRLGLSIHVHDVACMFAALFVVAVSRIQPCNCMLALLEHCMNIHTCTLQALATYLQL